MKKKEQQSTPPAARPPESERSKRLRLVLEIYQVMEQHGPMDWPDRDEIRALAEALDVPYLFLLLEFDSTCAECHLKLEDIAEWNTDPEAQRVLAAWWASAEHPADAGKAVA